MGGKTLISTPAAMAKIEKNGKPNFEKKRKAGALASRKLERKSKRKAERDEKKRRKSGPRLPSVLRKELDLINPKSRESDGDSGSGSDHDAYEYEEGVAQEETKKNRRFDAVDNLEYELPREFEDEDLPSDDDDALDGDEGDEGSHARMLQGITGFPSEVFEGNKRNKEPLLTCSNPTSTNDVKISIHDLLDPLHGKKGYSDLRKKANQLDKKPMTLSAPLAKVQRQKVERKVAYEHSKKDITKWEPLVKRNREAPTIYFEEDTNVGFSTVGAIACEFEPRTEFEKQMALLTNDPKVVDAHKNDGLRLLELNEISVEDIRERQNRLAKMRSLLFCHDMKQKRIKKIKSKTYHRLLKKDKSKAASDEMLMDPEAIQEEALKQEFRRAEERLTLKHKNKSKWAKRILKRGLKAQDEGTRAAMAEQLRQHQQLTRKMNSMRDSSSEESSDEEDLSFEMDKSDASNLLVRAKEKTLQVIGEEDEMPKSGILSLPFMVRGLKKKQDVVDEEARLALQEFDVSLGKLEDVNEAGIQELGASSGRKVFGVPKIDPQIPKNKSKSDNIYDSGDSEPELQMEEANDDAYRKKNEFPKTRVEPLSLVKEPTVGEETILQNFSNASSKSKSTYEVALYASGSWKKVNSEKPTTTMKEHTSEVKNPALPTQDDLKVADDDSDTDSDIEMVDGIPSSVSKRGYDLPSQDDLIRRAFAGDDVEVEFEKDKLQVLNDESPEPEKPLMLPGWGQWTDIQQKKGLPSWMAKEHEDAKRRREEGLRKRKDAHLKHVIISEKTDKKAEKLHAKTLPFPFTSKEIFQQSIRMPIGPDYNPATSVGALNRPAVVKESGIIIKPIKFEEVDPHAKDESNRRDHKLKMVGKEGKTKGHLAKK